MQRSERSATGGKKNTKTEGGAQSLYVISPLSECCFVFLPTFLYHVPKFKHVSYIPKSGSSPLSQQNFHFGELSVEKVKRPKKKSPSHISADTHKYFFISSSMLSVGSTATTSNCRISCIG